MANIRLKRSAVSAKTPLVGDLDLGEMAINTYDGKVFIKKDNGVASVVEVGGGGGGTGEHYDQEAAPTPTATGATWYVPSTNKAYIYVNDGAGDIWFDISTQTSVVYDKTQYEAVGGETTYNVVYDPGYIDIFSDGNKLIDGVDFTASDGNTVNFTNALVALDKLTFQSWNVTSLAPTPNLAVYVKTQYQAVGGETIYNIVYDPGYIDIFSDGNKLIEGVDFTAVDGSTVNFTNALIALEKLTFQAWNVTHLGPINANWLSTTNTFTGPQIGAVTAENDLSFDLVVSNNFSCTPVAAGTLTFTNLSAGQSGNIVLDNTGGHAISKDAAVLADSNFLTTISAAGKYWVSYNSTDTEVYVATSSAVS